MPLHPAWAKNITRRVLAATISPDPSRRDREQVEAYFGSRCAYCATDLPKKWHLDHLVPFDQGGSNHISNRVPACPTCNEHEKREKPWDEFLREKCAADLAAYQTRRAQIEAWAAVRSAEAGAKISPELRAAWEREVALVGGAIDQAHQRLRAVRAMTS